MYLFRLLAVFLGVLFILTFTSTGLSANFYVVAGGGKKVGIEIKQLPYTISGPGFYYITKNLDAPVGSNAITLETGAHDVTIDLMGFAITGPPGSGEENGIFSDSYNYNVEIRNGTITGFDGRGMYVTDEENAGIDTLRILNVRFCYNDYGGIFIIQGNGLLIKDCAFFDNGRFGIWCYPRAQIIGNSCYRNGNSGIRSGWGSTVTGNDSSENKGNGIEVDRHCIVAGNTCNFNKGNGIETELYSNIFAHE